MKAKISLFLFLGLIFPLLIGAVGAPANLDNAIQNDNPSALHDPLIFIPGIQGSQLFNTVSGSNHLVWINYLYILPWFNLYRELDVLGLAADGISPADPSDSRYTTVHTLPGTAGLILKVAGPWPFTNLSTVYQTIVDHFTVTHGYVENTDFWAFPYDWRKDNAISAAQLDTLVDSVLQQTGKSQVTIVAHSMGGLVTRRYIEDPTRAAKVKHAIMIASPFIGTPDAFDVLLEGSTLMEFKTVFGTIDLPPKSETKKLAQNYPAFYQLFPSQAYFTLKGGGYFGDVSEFEIKKECPDCLSFSDTYTTSVASNLNVPINTQADAFHQSLDQLTDWNDVKVDLIGGVGYATTVGIQTTPGFDWIKKVSATHITPIFSVSGDGTVTSLSSSLYNPLTDINLRGSATYNTFYGNHIGLTQDETGVLPYVDQLLGIDESSPHINALVKDELALVQLTAFGSSNLMASDSQGNTTGYDEDAGTSLYNIEGSKLHSTDAHSSLALTQNEVYTISIDSDGALPIDLRMIHSNYTETLTVTLFTDIRPQAGDQIVLTGDLANGEYEIELQSLSEPAEVILPTLTYTDTDSMDRTPPEVQVEIDGTPNEHGWYTQPVTVTLSATDNLGGSGIARIQYAFFSDSTPRYYEGPFLADPQQVSFLYVNATDEAQNISETIRVVIGPAKVYLPLVQRE
jgi:pimeloyl-ACP methyl ester carboxylesterase